VTDVAHARDRRWIALILLFNQTRPASRRVLSFLEI
jgi:hypothetical protein